jgi:hypothetical protein
MQLILTILIAWGFRNENSENKRTRINKLLKKEYLYIKGKFKYQKGQLM